LTQSVHQGDLYINGSLSSKTFTAPDASVTNAMIAASAGIAATKVVHQIPVRYSSAVGSAATSATQVIHIARTAGTINSIEVVAETAPTSTDTVTVDLKAGNSSTAYASVLSSVVTLDNTTSDREVVAGTISTADYSDGDSLELVVTVTGSSCEGLCVLVNLFETAI
jgi:hypothetical protein